MWQQTVVLPLFIGVIMFDFINYIFDYLFSFLAFDICLWILVAVALISIFLILRYILSGGLK